MILSGFADPDSDSYRPPPSELRHLASWSVPPAAHVGVSLGEDEGLEAVSIGATRVPLPWPPSSSRVLLPDVSAVP